jgi:hypothetical protein
MFIPVCSLSGNVAVSDELSEVVDKLSIFELQVTLWIFLHSFYKIQPLLKQSKYRGPCRNSSRVVKIQCCNFFVISYRYNVG